MKKLKYVLTACLAFSLTAQAQEVTDSPEHNNYPVNYDKCGLEIVDPPESSGVVMSRDCKTAYVKPAKKGKVDIQVNLNEGPLRGLCGAYKKNFENYTSKASLLEKLRAQHDALENTPRNEAERARIAQQIVALEKDLFDNLHDPFKKISGGSALVSLDSTVSQELLDKYLLANRLLVRQSGLQFKAMPISNGYIALSIARSGDDVDFPETLDVDLNLVPAEGETKGKKIYKMQDLANGQIVLGLGKGCELYNSREAAAAKGVTLSPTDLGRELLTTMAPTVSYYYNVMSTLRYSAHIDFERAARLLFDQTKLKGQFKVGEFTDLLGNGEANDAFQIDIDLGLLAARLGTVEDKETFVATLIEQVRTRLGRRLLDEINAISTVVDFDDKSKELEVPEPGTKDEFVRMERVCSTKSILGVPVSKSCRDQAVTRRVNVDGTLERILEENRTLNINVSEGITIHELLPARGNVIF